MAGSGSGFVTTLGFSLHSPSYEMGGKVTDLQRSLLRVGSL